MGKFYILHQKNHFKLFEGAPPLSSLEKDKEIDLELLQDLMEVDIDPLDIDLEKDPLAAKVFKVWSTRIFFAIKIFHLILLAYWLLKRGKYTLNVTHYLVCSKLKYSRHYSRLFYDTIGML